MAHSSVEHLQLYLDISGYKQYHTRLYGIYNIEIMNYLFYTSSLTDDLVELRSNVLIKSGQENQYFLGPCASSAFNSNNSNQIFYNIRLNDLIDFTLYNKQTNAPLNVADFKFGLLDLQLTKVE